MKILALDPAARCGFAHSDGHRGVWLLTAERDRHPGARLDRLKQLIKQAFTDWGFERIAYEDATFGAANNLEVAALHNELRGVIKLSAHELGVEAVSVNPTTLKKFATGTGRAKKEQMIRACKTILGISTDDDNVADACFILEYAKQPEGVLQQTAKVRKRKARVARAAEPKLFR